MRFIALDGSGAPNSEPYFMAVQAIYSCAYPLKFISRKSSGVDYVVPPLEALWWADNPNAFGLNQRNRWKWTLLSRVPDWVTDEDIENALQKAQEKSLDATNLYIKCLNEGLSFQMLHVGLYSAEARILAELHNVTMPHGDYTFSGDHHEIYLNDPRQTDPIKMKTIL